jgi:lipid-A-disaccharide synthase
MSSINSKFMPKSAHLLIVAGDPSADRHGAALVDALRSRRPDIRITALGGTYLREKANRYLYPLVDVGGFGFWEPLAKLPQLWAARKTIKELIQNDRPDIVIPMDYYGFNIHTARLAHQAGIPVAYYISPQVWASRPGRIRKLAAVINKMLVIFPFEEPLYEKAGVPVSFVGHPLLERLPAPAAESGSPTIGLLPGSRPGIVARHLPLLIQTAELLHREFPQARCILFRPEEISPDFYQPYLAQTPWIELTGDATYDTRKNLWMAISVSGTAALENMVLGIPMIIMYKLSRLTYWIARMLIRVPYVGIPNILAGKPVVPELLQDEATPENLVAAAIPLLKNTEKRQAMRQTLLSLRATLQDGGSARAADEILSVIPADAGIHNDGSPMTASGMTSNVYETL